MTARPIFAIVSLVLIAGATLLIFLVLLAGAVNGFPVNQIYFLEADTSSIPGAFQISRWTLWNMCGDSNGNDFNCGKVMAAFPFDPQSNFNSQMNVPAGFIGTNQFYYMSRVVFAFTLIALFFTVSSLFIGVLALCSRIGSYLSSVTAFIALLMQTVTCAVMTSCYVMGRNMFNANNMPASVGKEAFGFFWASWLCLLIASVLFCVGGATSSSSGGRFSRGKKGSRDRGSFAADAETSSFVRS